MMNLTVSYLFTFIVKKKRFRNIEIVKRNNIKKPSQLTCHIPEAVLNSEGTVYSDWHIPFFSSSFPSLFFFSRFFFSWGSAERTTSGAGLSKRKMNSCPPVSERIVFPECWTWVDRNLFQIMSPFFHHSSQLRNDREQ